MMIFRIGIIKSRRGGIALEAAIIVTIFVLLIYFMLNTILVKQMEVAIAGALENTAAEIALLVPLIDAVIDHQDIVNEEFLYDGFVDDSFFTEIFTNGDNFFEEILKQATLDLASSLVFGNFIEARSRFWLEESAAGQNLSLNLMSGSQLRLDWRESSNQLILVNIVHFRTLFGIVEREIIAAVPLWVGKSRFAAEDFDTDKDSVWLLDNFSRGRALREYYGGNLPFNYPVIAAFNVSEAISIKSMDLTAPSYQNYDQIIKTISVNIKDLAGFSGHQSASENYPDIYPEDILSRKLLLIIPENSPDSFWQSAKSDLDAIAASYGVILEIKKHGKSYKYQNNE